MKEDNIDKRIERTIESVGSKKAAMCQWESDRVSSEQKRKVAAKRWRTYGISAAASVAVICGIGISFYFTRYEAGNPDMTTSAPIYRSGSSDIAEIHTMIDSGKYEMALRAIDATLADTIIDPSFTQERQEYLRDLNANQDYELTWLKINILVETGKKTEAIKLLKDYIKRDGEHKQEAETLLKDLTE